MDMIVERMQQTRLGHACPCPPPTKQLSGKPEFYLLLDSGKDRYLDRTEATQCLKHVVDQFLGRRSAGGNPDHICTPDPRGIQLASIGDEVARYPCFCAYLAQAVRI